MNWNIHWRPAAHRGLLNLRWHTAERLDAAVLLFAATGRGSIKRIVPTDPRRIRLFTREAVAVLYLERETTTLYVVAVFART